MRGAVRFATVRTGSERLRRRPQVKAVAAAVAVGVAFGPPTAKTPYDDYTGFTKIFDGDVHQLGWARPTCGRSSGRPAARRHDQDPGQHHIHYIGPAR